VSCNNATVSNRQLTGGILTLWLISPLGVTKEKHPHYRDFFVDPNPPLKASPKTTPKLDWRKLLSDYEKKRGCPLKPVNPKNPETKVPKGSVCRSL